MNAMLTDNREQRSAAERERLVLMRARADEVTEYIRLVRRQVDNLWHAARDATRTDPCFTRESNREGADNAAFEALQCLYHAEQELDLLKEER